tara:strand:- start:391 stop:1017 length:627 start_codon:yes stop_codon:yes gene_type:complete
MPVIVQKSISNNISLSIWSIEESLDFFLSNLRLTKNCEQRLDKLKSDEMKKQFLAVRKLIQLNGISLDSLSYSSEGIPFLNSEKNISISHTKGFSAIAISPKPVGIDIQDFRDKILSISKKFINSNERDLIDPSSIKELTLVWCIKEATYKVHRKPGLDFKDEIKIQSISNNLSHSTVEVEKLDKKYFFESFNITESDYICSIVQSNE